MLKRILFTNLLLLALCLTFNACSNPPYETKTNLPATAAPSAKVVFLDKDLRRTLAVDGGSIVESRTAAGYLQTQIGLRNMTNDQTLSIQIQTLFQDANGVPLYTEVGNDAAWQNLVLTPGQTSYYKQSALNAAAQNYVIRVRYMNRKDAGN